MQKKFYITTAIPYVNAAPHIGHALEFVQADTIARTHKLLGDQVCLLSGGDENALKNVKAAEVADTPVQQFVDTNTELFVTLAKKLSVSFDRFQKGSDQIHHFPSCQKLWNLCKDKGDIYKKSYEGLYCVGCEAFYTKDELNENGECFEHPGKKLELVKEENYFFKLSSYQKKLIDLITSDSLKIVPDVRKNEVLSFLKQPLLDISISRSNSRAKNWGVPVPDDDNQKMYVWFDALNIYQSGVGFGWDEKSYNTWWPADVHVIGKGIIRFHAVYWIAFLLSAGLPIPTSLFVHGYFTVNGQKMGKTIGNVIDPNSFIDTFGADSVRYYLLSEIPPFADGDFSEERFTAIYNADLANGLGNLVSRTAKLAEGKSFILKPLAFKTIYEGRFRTLMEEFKFNEALFEITKDIKETDIFIDQNAPWKLDADERREILTHVITNILAIAVKLKPFLPTTANTIIELFTTGPVSLPKPLFPRIEKRT